METFAGTYFHANKGQDIASQDATFVLAYSVIMLNTDQHNPQVRNRMTFEQFCKNTRGVNDGKDFATEYMLKIYETIQASEIIMPEEREGELSFLPIWKQIQKKFEANAPMDIVKDSRYDQDMFEVFQSMINSTLRFSKLL